MHTILAVQTRQRKRLRRQLEHGIDEWLGRKGHRQVLRGTGKQRECEVTPDSSLQCNFLRNAYTATHAAVLAKCRPRSPMQGDGKVKAYRRDLVLGYIPEMPQKPDVAALKLVRQLLPALLLLRRWRRGEREKSEVRKVPHIHFVRSPSLPCFDAGRESAKGHAGKHG